ncbi:uncharacterized protein LACBIDRAFT_323919 [Laccaria bicolor S238N-H82]|uniref:Predicted protein n=1 Tax=Laccaria bicolor (strain S238N-H82 / ATCC MYA-4686) TaxID=486041 RepID=B0D025_LACBS|nr:uncharacterized protein LACBIDRAFT_323919 [Laccaria bicolor S238N-H82]EDR11382.1 predicted protein [Laccaria bicolor S238N-H82]|eukprot:XP_001877279.1 predicted protein [Laccaria bicolor S238N-H82]
MIGMFFVPSDVKDAHQHESALRVTNAYSSSQGLVLPLLGSKPFSTSTSWVSRPSEVDVRIFHSPQFPWHHPTPSPTITPLAHTSTPDWTEAQLLPRAGLLQTTTATTQALSPSAEVKG